jgi:TorA maturation chaperone TorD
MSLPPEEEARAHFYALLARLFYAAPDAALLSAIAGGKIEGEEPTLARAWQELAQAAGEADPEALRGEYESAFIGTGKAPVTLYTGAYTIRYTNEVPLAKLRGELSALGLARQASVSEPEDHIAALCDTMRHLIAEQQRDLEEQKRFFNRWIAPAADPLCTAIETAETTCFYRRVGRFAKAFLTVEQLAFEML